MTDDQNETNIHVQNETNLHVRYSPVRDNA